MYLILSQQIFVPDTCGESKIIYYGKKLYLSIDLSHFIYEGDVNNLIYFKTISGVKYFDPVSRSGRLGKMKVKYKEHYYLIKNTNEFIKIIQTASLNPYPHPSFEFNNVSLNGMKFEMMLGKNI